MRVPVFKWGWISTPWQQVTNSYPQKNIAGFTTKKMLSSSPSQSPASAVELSWSPWGVNHHEYKVLSLKDKFMVFKICSVVQFCRWPRGPVVQKTCSCSGSSIPVLVVMQEPE